MATVIGIFEKKFENNKRMPLLVQEHNQEDLPMYLILFKYVMKLGKKINVATTVYPTLILTQSFK